MTPDLVLLLAQEAGITVLLVAGPMLVAALVTGLAVSLFQAVTQIQEMTLTFIPKMLAMLLILAVLGHWMLGRLVGFTTALLVNLNAYGR